MYHFLKGKIDEIRKDFVVLNVNCIGFKIYLSTIKQYSLNEEVKFLVHTVYKEDEQYLIGFSNSEEKEMFSLLITCKGIGPKTALHILRSTSVNLLKNAIINEDVHYLKSLPTLGVKVANQIILDLKNKINIDKFLLSEEQYIKMNEVRNVLRSFGYKNKDIESVLLSFKQYDMKISDIVKELVSKLSISYGNK